MKDCIKHWSLFLLMTLSGIICHAQTTAQADSLHQRGRELVGEGKITEGRECTRQAMEIRRRLLGEVSEDYINSLNNYAYSFGAEENYPKAVELQEQVLALCAQLPSPHKNIGMYTTNMGRYYYLTGNKEKAAEMWERARPLVEKFGEIYEYILNGLSSVYTETNNQEGIRHVMALAKEHNDHELTKPCNEPQCMLERAQYYGSTGDQAQAKEYFLKVLAMPLDDEMKAKVHEAYATYLTGPVDDHAAGADYYLSAAQLRKSIEGETEAYANLMYKAAVHAFIAKKFKESISAYEVVIAFYQNINSPAAKANIAQCRKGIGNAYSGMKDYAKAKEYYTQVVTYYEQTDTTGVDYPKAILRLAKAEKFNKDYEASIAHHKHSMALFEQQGLANEYADAASSLQTCYVYAGIKETVDLRLEESQEVRMARIDTLIQSELEGLELAHKYLGELVYARSLSTLGGCYKLKGDWENSVKYYQMYMDAIRQAIRDEFRLQSEAERMIVWDNETDAISQVLELLLELPEEHQQLMPSLASITYDAELLSKGILLNSSIELGKVLAAQDDAKLKQAFEQSKAIEAEIGRLRASLSSEEDLDKILQLTREYQSLQLDLYRGCAEYADYTNYISYTWKDVRDTLKTTDIAIEFAVVGSSILKEENQLLALVLTRDMQQPQVVRVCNLQQLKELETAEDIFQSPSAGATIWGALQPYLAGKQRLFFSADGSLNCIAIEYLPVNGTPLSEQMEVYRLSSTKELCYHRKYTKPSKVAIFGDINYNNDATRSEASESSLASLRGSGDAGSFEDLSNTLREITGIQEILENKGVKDTAPFRDTEASKAAFMELTDSKVNLIHIATHGVFKEAERSSDAESMNNSLLAFAGANFDDSALVTAADIAGMNLRQCELAVLSACETGLGRLSGDGVFGLQRGFKNAGVHTLLMSLKKVYDDSTADLMIAFYKHLMEGASEREALVEAQRELRRNGFDDPKYWATFILLDALP